jgi:hypothetical protein
VDISPLAVVEKFETHIYTLIELYEEVLVASLLLVFQCKTPTGMLIHEKGKPFSTQMLFPH